MSIVAHTAATEPEKLVIYAETANINYFLDVDLVPDGPGTATEETVTVSGYTRRQYPGDETPVAVSASARTYLSGLSRRQGAALPGKNFRLVAFDDDGAQLEDRQFTYVGTWRTLLNFLEGQIINRTHVYNHTGGTPVVLEVPAAP